MKLFQEHDRFLLYAGKTEDGIPIDSASCDALVCDPPSSINFMGQHWDSDKGGRTQWTAWLARVMAETLRILKPGAHGLVWALPRRSHWTALALEDAGFEIRDIVYHVFAEGFPKNLDVSKKIDAKLGAERRVIGTKTNTYDGSVRDPAKHSNPAADSSFGKWGLTKTPHGLPLTEPATPEAKHWSGWGTALKPAVEHWILVRKPLLERDVTGNVMKFGVGAINIDASRTAEGRYPSHLLHDGVALGEHGKYFYAAKPGKKERSAGCSTQNAHPSVKPLVLMRYLVKLVTPANGVVLDVFTGSGTTGVAALTDGFGFVGVEENEAYCATATERLLHCLQPNK